MFKICSFLIKISSAYLPKECQITYFLLLAALRRIKRARSLRGPSPRHCAWATQLLSKTRCSSGDTVSNLTGPRFESQTYRSEEEPVTVRKLTMLVVDVAMCQVR